MVFSSPLFLFLFLPLVLSLYALLPGVRVKTFPWTNAPAGYLVKE